MLTEQGVPTYRMSEQLRKEAGGDKYKRVKLIGPSLAVQASR